MGCDYGIDSNAVEDRCGVCLGDGTSCEKIYKSFDEGEGFGESNTRHVGAAGSKLNNLDIRNHTSITFK